MDQFESTVSEVQQEREIARENEMLDFVSEIRRRVRRPPHGETILTVVALLLTLFLAFSAGVSYSRMSMTDTVLENAREVNELARDHEKKAAAAMQRAQETERQVRELLAIANAAVRPRQQPQANKDCDAGQVSCL